MSGITLRDLRTPDDYAACIALQEETWGAGFSERVPGAILKVAQRVGGVTAGAFDGEGRLLGIVFGLTGVERGEIVHWSDMLAVRADARDRGLGRRLKEYQREKVRAVGGRRIYWTYDPLVARNARLNLGHLGARVVEYARDMYGPRSDSVLHRGLGTDRFVVAWAVDPADRLPAVGDGTEAGLPEAWRRAPLLNAAAARLLVAHEDAPPGGGRAGAPAGALDRALDEALRADEAGARPDALARLPGVGARVAIPRDVARVQAASVALAGAWRASTRRALEACLAAGLRVAGTYTDAAAPLAHYLLAAGAPAHD
jgi:predicted GNAT superfamily acetyltransferase